MNNLSVIDQVKVLVRYNGKYLLLKKVKDIHPDHIGCFEVPGGKVKPKEDSIFAALREVKEETGLNCKIITELKPLNLDKEGIHTLTRIFLAESFTAHVNLSKEHSDYIWVVLNEINYLDKVIYKELLLQYVGWAEKVV
ncbi:NUDIX hydrolase [Candidatus Woesearchaeota archaeon]|nr:NUDIX hydrolase [Candidatus Woesearchaeota archaeon]